MRSLTTSPRTVLRLTQATLAVVALNIVSGAAVRLSDSGLGCPDWPTCSRTHLTAPLAGHAGIEFGNRLVVVVLVVATAVTFLAAWRRSPRRRDLTWLSGGLIGGVLAEAAVGGLVVYSHLNAYVVMTHFMVGMVLLADAVVLALRAGRPDTAPVAKVGPELVVHSRVLVGWLFLVLIAGTATTGAGPHAGGPGAKRVPLALEDAARIHSSLVLVLIAVTGLLLIRLYRRHAPESVQQRGRLLLAAMVVQGTIGYTQYFTHLPALLVGVHVFGAAVVWTTALWFHSGLFHHGVAVEQPSSAQPAGATTRAGAGQALVGGAGMSAAAGLAPGAVSPPSARPGDLAPSARPGDLAWGVLPGSLP